MRPVSRHLSHAILFLAALAGLSGPRSLGAQSPEARLDLGEFTVDASAESPQALAPAGSIVVLEAEDIERSGAATVAEALESAAGSTVLSYGPRGAASSLSLRGSNSAQVLVILDGQRLNDARQGAPDLSQIPAASIATIEILSGGASAVYGADALGGVVVITSKRAAGRRLSLDLSNSAYPGALSQGGAASLGDGQRLALEGSLPLGAAGLSFAATGERAANAYPYGGSELRDNAGLLSGSARFGLELPLGAGIASASLSGSYQDAEVPGDFIYGLWPVAWQKDTTLRASLGWSSDALADGLLSLELRGQAAFTRIDFSGPYSADLHDMASGSGDIRASLLISEALELGFGGSLSYEAAQSTQFAALAGGQPERFSIGGYLSPNLRMGRLKLVPTFRFDWNEDYATGLTAMLGLVYEASEMTELKLSGGTSYRAPTFNELYWPFMGNAELEAERGFGIEASASYRAAGLSLKGAAFSRLVGELIQLDETFIPQNIGRAFLPGASLDAAYRSGLLQASAAYEFLYPLDYSGAGGLGAAVRLKSISMHQLKAYLGLAFEAAEAGLSGRFASERISGATSLPATLVLDLRGRLELSEGLTLSLAAENLLDAEYEVIAGYPMPGLRLVSALKLEL